MASQMVKFCLLLSVLVSSVLLPLFAVRADVAGWNLLILPNKKEYYANPGDQIRGSMKVRNDGDVKIVGIALFAKDFTANDEETGDPRFLDEIDSDYQHQLAVWMEFSQEPFDLEPGKSIDIEYLINVPPDAEPGGHYGILYLRQVSGAEGQTTMGFMSQIGKLILVTVSGDIQVDGDILEFFSGKTLYEYLPVDLYLRMRNVGNVHFRPAGTIFIYNWRDELVGTVDINESRGVVLPSSIRKYQSYWKEAFLVENFQRDAAGNVIRDAEGERVKKLTVDWKKWNLFRLGKYSAKVIVVFDDQNMVEQQLIATTTFWVLPWRLILATLIGTFLLIWGLIKFNKWYKKKLIEKYEQKIQGDREQKKIEHQRWKENRKKRQVKRQRIREMINKVFGSGSNGNGKKSGSDKDKTNDSNDSGSSLTWKE